MNLSISRQKSSLILFTLFIIFTWQAPVYSMKKPTSNKVFLSRAALARPRKPEPTRVASAEEIQAMTEAIRTADHDALAAIIGPGEFDINTVRVQHIIRDRAEDQFIILEDSVRISNPESLLWHAVDYLLHEADEDEVEKRLKIIDLLLYHDANPNQPGYFFHDGKKFRCQLLHVAVHRNKPDLAQLLKSYQADPELTDQYGKKPAHYLGDSRSLIMAAILGVVAHHAITAAKDAAEDVEKDVEGAVASAVGSATGSAVHSDKQKPAKSKDHRGYSLRNCCW